MILLPVAGVSGQFPLTSTPGEHSYRVENAFIEARDGVRLHAKIWMPTDLEGPAPSIFTLTPYTSDDAHRFGRFYASHGYVYVNADVRGRGESEGQFWPMARDGLDGADLVQWITQQPWSDGKVGMRGGSYRGMTQWQTLKEFPEGLVSIVPTASGHPGWDFPAPSGIFLSYMVQWFAYVNGQAAQTNLFSDAAYWSQKNRELYESDRPFSELDDFTGIPSRVFERWIEHPWYDEFWQGVNPGPEEYARMDIPILTITGHFDGDQPGALKYYRDHMSHAPDAGKANHYLIMGPWDHAGTRIPQPELGGFPFGENSVVDIEAIHLAWFDWTMRGGPKPGFLRDRVAYYVMEVNEWRFAPTLEAVSGYAEEWYLNSNGPVSDVFHSGILAPGPAVDPGVDQFVYDPLDKLDEAEALAPYSANYVSGGLAFLRAPKAIYHSSPLERPLLIAGEPRLELYVELDVPDIDLVAALYEIRPDGSTLHLGKGELRARHRHGVDRVDLVEPGSIERFTFDRFYWFSRQLLAGSRLRLVVTPLNSPDRDKNYNSGGNTIEETAADARTATVRIHRGPRYPSKLILPVSGG